MPPLDFVSDALTDGCRFSIPAVVDDLRRENLMLVADTSLSGLRVTRELDRVIAGRGMQKAIFSDNGAGPPAWRSSNGFRRRVWVGITSHQESPSGTASLKALTARCEMNALMKRDLAHCVMPAKWQEDHNRRRPYLALENLTPMEFWQRKAIDKMAA